MPTDPIWALLLTVVAPVVSLIGTIGVGILTYRSSHKTKTIEATASPYAELSKRVVHLEGRVESMETERGALRDQVERLEHEREEDRRALRRLVELIETHGLLVPFPLPAWLRVTPAREDI